MCVNNNIGLSSIIVFSIPVALIILNVLLAKFTKFYKKNKTTFIVVSVISGVVWFIRWFFGLFFTKCI